MKGLSRYGVIDAYTLEELCRKYKMSDAKGRIHLLKRFWNGRETSKPYPPNLPFEIALMAVEDSNVGIRQWVARNARYLNFEPLESPHKLYDEYDTAPHILSVWL